MKFFIQLKRLYLPLNHIFATIRSVGKCSISISHSRYESNSGGEREIQRTMLELLNQLDGFDSRGDVKVCIIFSQKINSHLNFQYLKYLRQVVSCREEKILLCSVSILPFYVSL